MEADQAIRAAGDDLIFTLFLAAMSRPESERAGFLREACSGNTVLLAEVVRRVTWEKKLNGFLLTPVLARNRIDLPFAPGDTVLRRFQILRLAGEGGMGVVYEAFDEKLGHRIALKVPRFEFRKRLTPEALKSLRVTHPNVCRVFEVHTAETNTGEIDFLTMEFLDGETVAARLARAPERRLETPEFREIAYQLCNGLAAIHAEGIVHRDLKPGNVMLSSGKNGTRTVIMDFGIAQEGDIFASQARGTPAYLAPELWKGQPATVQSDIYALGVLLYEMVCGHKPFSEGVSWEDRLRSAPAPPPVRGALRSAILKCLHPNRKERFRDANELADALRGRTHSWRRIAMVGFGSSLLAGMPLYYSGTPSQVVPLSTVHRQIPPQRRVAVLPFHNVARIAADQPLCDRLTQTLTSAPITMRQSHANLQVSTATDVLRPPADSPARARRDFGANLVIEGRVERSGVDLRVYVSLVATASSRRIASFMVAVPADHPYSPQDEITHRVITLLNLDQGRTPSDSAYELYSQALARLQRYDLKGNIDSAIVFLTRAVRQDPAYANAWASLSEAYWRRYNETRAIADRQAALDMAMRATSEDPLTAAGHVCLGRVYAVTGDYEKAIAEYEEAQRLDPAASPADLEIAEVLASRGLTDEAEAAYRRALIRRPDDWPVLTSLGIFYWDRGRYDQAEVPFLRIVDLQPDNPVALRNLAVNDYMVGNYERAASEAEHTLRLRPNYTAYLILGDIQFAKGEYRAAVGLYRQAIGFSGASSSPAALTSLANGYRWEPELKGLAPAAYRQAIEVLDRAVAANPQDGVALAIRALNKAKIGDFSGASTDSDRAASLAPQDVDVLAKWAEAQELCHRRVRALNGVSRAVRGGYPAIRILHNPEFEFLRKDPRFNLPIARKGEDHGNTKTR